MLLCPLAAQAQLTPSCGPRFQSAFVRANAILTQREMASPGRATIEVSNLFGPRQDLCEPGAYQAFLDSFVDLARSAIRAPAKHRDGAVRLATAVLGVLPTQVPPQELKSAGASFRQVRSDLYAIADDVGNPPAVRPLLDAYDRAGPPTAATVTVPVAPPPPPPPPVGTPPAQGTGGTGTGQNVLQVRVPATALPSWAVVNLYEAREALKNRDVNVAKDKLELVLRWMETAP